MAMIPTAAQYRAMFRPLFDLIDSVGDPITLHVRNAGGTLDPVGPVNAKVSAFRLEDIIPGGPAMVGDLRFIIKAASLSSITRVLDKQDRIEWAGRFYAIINWDTATHAVGNEVMAIDAIGRG